MNRVKELTYGQTRCYLIGGSVLVDTDWAGTLPRFLKRVRDENVDLAAIRYLLVTHFHPDHMGIAQELADLGMRIVIFDEQQKAVHQADGVFAKDKRVRFRPVDESRALRVACADSRALLETVGVYGQVLHTPGHSEDSISIVLDDGMALVGDLPPLSWAAAYRDEKVNRSWADILSHSVHTLYYAHAEAERR
ncbi:MAG: MBL fold metallo-hydrolase [Eubacteriales bacterium]|nr:MBL fold metallo-hydrolase [Eubacteriales bacterium]